MRTPPPTRLERTTGLLFGGGRLLQVPHLERVVLGGGDEHGFHRVECQRADAVEVAPQGELGVPRLPHGVRVVADLQRGRLISAARLRRGGSRFKKLQLKFRRKHQSLLLNSFRMEFSVTHESERGLQ